MFKIILCDDNCSFLEMEKRMIEKIFSEHAIKGEITCLHSGKELLALEDTISDYLDTAGIPDPDLMIRTSGELRLSNYLLWQLAYSEFYFTDVPWPDFKKEELVKAIEKYNERDRRYGGVKEE